MFNKENPRRVLKDIESTDFLQACTLLHTRQKRLEKAASGVKESDLPQISCKREALLSLPLAAYSAHADAIEAGFIEAASFLNEIKIILAKERTVPSTDHSALASILSVLGDAGQTAAARDKLASGIGRSRSVSSTAPAQSQSSLAMSRSLPHGSWTMARSRVQLRKPSSSKTDYIHFARDSRLHTKPFMHC